MTSRVHSRPTIPLCSVCGKKNVSPAHILGHSNKGCKKPFSKEHRKFLSEAMTRVQAQYMKDLARSKALAVNTEKK